MKKFTKQFLAVVAASAFALPASALPYGGAGPGDPLQTVFDDITEGGTSNLVAATPSLSDGADSFWDLNASLSGNTLLVVEFAGYAGGNTFGIYDVITGDMFELYDGAASGGLSRAEIDIDLIDGTYIITDSAGNVDDSNLTFGSGFGFYLDSRTDADDNTTADGGLWYSDSTENSDGKDHMAAYAGNGDKIDVTTYGSNLDVYRTFGAGEYILAWEDLDCTNDTCDGDYTDFVAIIESITPVPEPSMIALMSLGLLGLGIAGRRKVSK